MASIYDGMSGPLPMDQGLYGNAMGFGSQLNNNLSQVRDQRRIDNLMGLDPTATSGNPNTYAGYGMDGFGSQNGLYAALNGTGSSSGSLPGTGSANSGGRGSSPTRVDPYANDPQYQQGTPQNDWRNKQIAAFESMNGLSRSGRDAASGRMSTLNVTPEDEAYNQKLNAFLAQNPYSTGTSRADASQNGQIAGPRNSSMTTPPAAPPQATGMSGAMNQAWMDANKGNWGGNLMNSMMSGGANNFKFDPMNIQWANFSNGNQENITRAMGVIGQGGDELAKMLGGTLVDSPFATFGTQQRDKYIKMPNGQMIDASAMAKSLQGASQSSNPFSSISDVIGLYQRENQGFNPKTNTDAINLVKQGVLKPTTPEGWNPTSFAGGNPTYTPSGPVPGNPGNPGMGTSNPVQFQNNQINAVNGQNGFPMFNYSQPTQGLPNNGGLYNQPQTGGGTNLPPAPQAPNVPQTPAPQGVNTNSNYYLPSSMSGQGGLYAQTGRSEAAGGAGGGGATINSASGGGRIGPMGDNQPFNQQAPKSSWAGNLPNGARSLGK